MSDFSENPTEKLLASHPFSSVSLFRNSAGSSFLAMKFAEILRYGQTVSETVLSLNELLDVLCLPSRQTITIESQSICSSNATCDTTSC